MSNKVDVIIDIKSQIEGITKTLDGLKKIEAEGQASAQSLKKIEEAVDGIKRVEAAGTSAADALKTGFGMDIAGRMMSGLSMLKDKFREAVEAGLEFNSAIESAQTQFTVLLGSATKAQARVQELYQFAAATPFQFPEILKASKVLETLTKGALSTKDGLRLVGDAAATAGVPFDELATQIGRAFDGIQSGRAVGESLMRLQELGLLSGDVRGQLEDLQKAGKKGEEVWRLLRVELEKNKGQMEALAATYEGRLSTLKDAMNAAFGEMTKPMFETMRKGFGDLTEAIGKIDPATIGQVAARLEDLASTGAKAAKWVTENAQLLLALASAAMSAGKVISAIKIASYVQEMIQKRIATLASKDALNEETAATEKNTVATDRNTNAKRNNANVTNAKTATTKAGKAQTIGDSMLGLAGGPVGLITTGAAIGIQIAVDQYIDSVNRKIAADEALRESMAKTTRSLMVSINEATNKNLMLEARTKAVSELAEARRRLAYEKDNNNESFQVEHLQGQIKLYESNIRKIDTKGQMIVKRNAAEAESLRIKKEMMEIDRAIDSKYKVALENKDKAEFDSASLDEKIAMLKGKTGGKSVDQFDSERSGGRASLDAKMKSYTKDYDAEIINPYRIKELNREIANYDKETVVQRVELLGLTKQLADLEKQRDEKAKRMEEEERKKAETAAKQAEAKSDIEARIEILRAEATLNTKEAAERREILQLREREAQIIKDTGLDKNAAAKLAKEELDLEKQKAAIGNETTRRNLIGKYGETLARAQGRGGDASNINKSMEMAGQVDDLIKKGMPAADAWKYVRGMAENTERAALQDRISKGGKDGEAAKLELRNYKYKGPTERDVYGFSEQSVARTIGGQKLAGQNAPTDPAGTAGKAVGAAGDKTTAAITSLSGTMIEQLGKLNTAISDLEGQVKNLRT